MDQNKDIDKKQEIETKLADLKKRWPAHSVPPSMWQELEKLEDELEKIEREANDSSNHAY